MMMEWREQIYNELSLRETEDLLEIWQANDREEWSDTAFEVIQEILSKRLGEVPPQQLSSQESEPEENAGNEGLEDWEARLLDDENQPGLYDTLDVLELRNNIDRVAVGVFIVYALFCFLNLELGRSLLRGVPMSFSEMLQSLSKEIVTILVYGLQIALIYFPLKALSQILRILMEMEFRSRKVG